MFNKKNIPVKKNRAHSAPAISTATSPVLKLQEEINNIFDNFFSGITPALIQQHDLETFLPRVNIAESGKDIQVSAELPGLEEKDVEVSVSRGLLTLKGRKQFEQEEKGKNYYHVERSCGSFCRDIPLPETVDTAKTQAVFKNGVLTVTLPKLPEAQQARKQIAIRSE